MCVKQNYLTFVAQLKIMRFSLIFLFLLQILYAQSISGTVQDQSSKTAMEYCTVSLYQSNDSSLVTGTITDQMGNFMLSDLKLGSYYLVISFIGFETKKVNDIILSKEQANKKIGIVYLGNDATDMQEFEVSAIKTTVRYELDKKVVDVDKNIAAANGTAVDVLATVPSIQTDIDGNISLRGSKGFLVLINGRPSVLDANEALQQIPASTIENIEIITNPSARYDAEGTAGIINIITKKSKRDGVSGLVNVRGGIYNTYGGDASLAMVKNKFTFSLSGNYNHRERPGNYQSELNTNLRDTIVSTLNDGTKNQKNTNYNAKAGIEFRPTEKQYISMNYNFGGFNMTFADKLDFSFINRTTLAEENFTNINESLRKGPFHEIDFNYGIEFKNKSKLTAHASFNKRGFNEEVINNRFDGFNNIIFGTLSTETGPSQRFRMNLDYVLPIQDHSKFELGFMQQMNKSEDENIAYQKNALGAYEEQSQFYSDVISKEQVRAFYGIFSSKWEKFSYQIGIRTENNLRNIGVNNTGASFILDRLDFFPSAHLSYNASDQHQFFISYSKRVDRPRGWFLEPNAIYTDANTLFRGNPSLLPEFIHAFETGWLFNFKKKGSWNNEVYFRNIQNVTQFVRIPLDFELTSQFPENIGRSNAIGWESSVSLLPLKWWNTDIMFNLFYFNLKGSYENENFDRSSFSSIIRWNNYFKIKKNTKIQFNASYASPLVNAQGKDSYTLRFDGGIKQDFFENKLSLGVQISDMFNTYINKSWLSGSNFDSYKENNPRGPSLIFSASYKINNYKVKKSNYEGGDDF